MVAAGQDGVASIRGAALSEVDRRGVTEFDVLADVGRPAAGLSDVKPGAWP